MKGVFVSQRIENYEEAVRQSEAAMSQDYYLNKPPFCGVPACIPFVPVEPDGTPALLAAEVQFKYVELVMDGIAYLAVLTPWKVANGPGKRYLAVEGVEGGAVVE